MEEKYSIKVIQNGQSQSTRVVRSGAGANGQAVVVNAQEAARFQILNMVTLNSPAKLALKKKGNDLQVALPGGDTDMPDLVIKDYFLVEGHQLQGLSQSGEWMVYDTAGLVKKPNNAYDKTYDMTGADNTAAVALANPPLALLGSYDSPWTLAGVGAGAAVIGSSGDSGGGSTDSSNTPFEMFKNYAKADTSGKVTAPTKANYLAAGVTWPSLGSEVKDADVLDGLNRVVNLHEKTDVVTLARLQQFADDFKSSYAVILAKANGAAAEDVTARLPTETDYANVGVSLGHVGKPLALLNSVLVEASASQVDSPTKLSAMAAACDNVMKVAAGTSGASVSATDLLALGIKLNNQNAGITSVQAKAMSANLANLWSGLGKSDDLKSGEAVDTQAELQALFSLQAMRSFNDDSAALDKKTQPAPGLSDYASIGVKAYKSLSDMSDASRVSIDSLGFAPNVNWQTTLNTALDTQAGGTHLTQAVIQNMVDAYYKILREAGSTTIDKGVYVNLASNNPTAADYTAIGVTRSNDAKTALASGNTLNLLNDAVGRLAVTAVDTVAEVQALEKAAENMLALGAGNGDGKATLGVSYTTDNNSADWISGFQLLGVQGVNNTNLSGVQAEIDSADKLNDGTGLDSVQALQAIVSLYRINDYADNDLVNAIPSASDYQAIVLNKGGKLTDVVTADNTFLTAYNDAVKNKPEGPNHNTFTETDVKKMVLSFNTILNEADGEKNQDATSVDPVKEDYVNVGVGNKNSLDIDFGPVLNDPSMVKLFTDVIGVKNKEQVNSIKELNDLALLVSRVQQLVSKTPNDKAALNDVKNYNDITGGPLSVKDFEDLGLDATNLSTVYGAVQTHRINDVMDHIIALTSTSDLDNLAKLQSFISGTSVINA